MGLEDGTRPARASGRRGRRISAGLKVLAPTVAVLGVGAAIAVGQIGGSDGTITGCVLTNPGEGEFSDQPVGSLRVVDPSSTITGDTSCTTDNEEQITWNQLGQTGPQGVAGQNGQNGKDGKDGQNGQNGQNGQDGLPGPPGPAGTVQVSSGPSADIIMYLAPADDLGKLGSTPVGESTNPTNGNPTKAFELTSFTLDAAHPTTIGSQSGGAGAGKVTFQQFQFVKPVDQYSAELFQDLASGTHLASIEIVVRKPGAKGTDAPVVQYLLKLVYLTNIHISGESRSPTETITGEFGAIQFILYGQKTNGQSTVLSKGGWNQITNSPNTNIPGLGTIRDTRRHRSK